MRRVCVALALLALALVATNARAEEDFEESDVSPVEWDQIEDAAVEIDAIKKGKGKNPSVSAIARAVRHPGSVDKATMREFTGELNRIKKKLQKMKHRLTKGIKALEKRIAKIKKDIAKHKAAIAKILKHAKNTKLKAVTKEHKAYLDKLRALKKKIAQLKKSLAWVRTLRGKTSKLNGKGSGKAPGAGGRGKAVKKLAKKAKKKFAEELAEVKQEFLNNADLAEDLGIDIESEIASIEEPEYEDIDEDEAKLFEPAKLHKLGAKMEAKLKKQLAKDKALLKRLHDNPHIPKHLRKGLKHARGQLKKLQALLPKLKAKLAAWKAEARQKLGRINAELKKIRSIENHVYGSSKKEEDLEDEDEDEDEDEQQRKGVHRWTNKRLLRFRLGKHPKKASSSKKAAKKAAKRKVKKAKRAAKKAKKAAKRAAKKAKKAKKAAKKRAAGLVSVTYMNKLRREQRPKQRSCSHKKSRYISKRCKSFGSVAWRLVSSSHRKRKPTPFFNFQAQSRACTWQQSFRPCTRVRCDMKVCDGMFAVVRTLEKRERKNFRALTKCRLSSFLKSFCSYSTPCLKAAYDQTTKLRQLLYQKKAARVAGASFSSEVYRYRRGSRNYLCPRAMCTQAFEGLLRARPFICRDWKAGLSKHEIRTVRSRAWKKLVRSLLRFERHYHVPEKVMQAGMDVIHYVNARMEEKHKVSKHEASNMASSMAADVEMGDGAEAQDFLTRENLKDHIDLDMEMGFNNPCANCEWANSCRNTARSMGYSFGK